MLPHTYLHSRDVLQEVITLSVFVPFSIWYLREPIKLDYLWAALCTCGAVYFIFRHELNAIILPHAS